MTNKEIMAEVARYCRSKPFCPDCLLSESGDPYGLRCLSTDTALCYDILISNGIIDDPSYSPPALGSLDELFGKE